MYKISAAFFLVVAFSLNHAFAHQYGFQVTFTDKNNTPYSLGSPLVYLSARALERRATQGIAVDSTDLPVNPAYVDSVLTLTGGVFHETSRWLNMCIILLSDSSQILNLAGKPFISDIKLVGYFNPDLHRDAGIIDSTALPVARKTTTDDSAYYGLTWRQTKTVNGNYLYDNGSMGQGKLIAVLDIGFDNVDIHPAFDSMRASGRLVDTHDFVYHDPTVFTQDTHGELVLSTMAGYIPGTFVGAAPLAMYALYNTEYDPNDQPIELDNLLCGAERADSIGADIITVSLIYTLFDYPPGSGQSFSNLDGKTTIAAKAANIATQKGMFFVTAAGNDGQGDTLSAPWGNHIGTPADADSALTVGAVDTTGAPTLFSSYGPNADAVIKPDVCALGDIASMCYSTSSYITVPGTSTSTPQIAGWAACLWQANPGATPYQIRQAIIHCASSYNDPGPQLGYGIPNFECVDDALSVKNITPSFTTANWVVAAPNPFNDDIKLSVSPATAGNVSFQLMDMTGKTVVSYQQYFYKGYNTPVALPAPDLPVGIYILRAVSAAQQQTVKLERY